MKEQNETLNCLKALCSFMANAPYVEVFPQHIRQSALPDHFYQFYRHADGGIGYIPPYRGHSLAGVPERQILLYTISRMAEKNREMRNLAKEIYLDCDPLREQEKLNKEETLRLNQFFDNCVIWGEVFDDPYDPDYLVYYQGYFFTMYRYSCDACIDKWFWEDRFAREFEDAVQCTFNDFLNDLIPGFAQARLTLETEDKDQQDGGYADAGY